MSDLTGRETKSRLHDRVPFPFAKEVAEFDQANVRDLGAAIRRAQASIIPEHNMLRFEHGSSWRSKQVEFADDQGELEVHSSEQSIQFAHIVEHRLSLFATIKTELVNAMMAQFLQSMFAKVSAGAERVGNVVDAKATTNMAEAYLEMLEKITFGVDRDGKVSMPQFHGGTEAARRFQADLAAMSPELSQRIEQAIVRKSQDALDAEAHRLSKFRAAAH